MNDWRKILRDRMAEIGLTQEGLAEKIEVTQGAVGHWITGRRDPGLDTINRMLKAAGLPGMIVPVIKEYSLEKAGASGNVIGESLRSYSSFSSRNPSPNLQRLQRSASELSEEQLKLLCGIADLIRKGEK